MKKIELMILYVSILLFSVSMESSERGTNGPSSGFSTSLERAFRQTTPRITIDPDKPDTGSYRLYSLLRKSYRSKAKDGSYERKIGGVDQEIFAQHLFHKHFNNFDSITRQQEQELLGNAKTLILSGKIQSPGHLVSWMGVVKESMERCNMFAVKNAEYNLALQKAFQTLDCSHPTQPRAIEKFLMGGGTDPLAAVLALPKEMFDKIDPQNNILGKFLIEHVGAVCKTHFLANRHCCKQHAHYLKARSSVIAGTLYKREVADHNLRRSNTNRALAEIFGYGFEWSARTCLLPLPEGRTDHPETRARIKDWGRNEDYFSKSGIAEVTGEVVASVMHDVTSRTTQAIANQAKLLEYHDI